MSSRLSHGLQTCLEPRVTESRILRLVLAPSKNENVSVERTNKEEKRNGKTSGLNFFEALLNTPLALKEPKDQEQVYVHPLVKKSRNYLSEKSLEMCTESLGSETGSNIMEGNVNDSAFSIPKNMPKTLPININGHSSVTRKNKVNRSRSFPPPLTSMTGVSGFVRVKPHREEGKLVLKAVSMPSLNPLFHSERVNGRLTLRAVKSEMTRNLKSC